ncbi:MAG: YgiT-type zinc finger protein [Actinobacteria bacterium]|nr:YgiT-type zinc finger protein [Actinomycetota bacterium]
MRCTTCDQVERLPVRRAKLAERDGRVAVVLDVPMEECPACGTRWLTMEVAKQLDTALDGLLAVGAETATTHWDQVSGTAA